MNSINLILENVNFREKNRKNDKKYKYNYNYNDFAVFYMIFASKVR